MQLGFNGQVQIPSLNTADYIVGSGMEHRYPWGIQVQSAIDVWAWHWNANPHTVYVRLDIDVQAAIDWAKPMPSFNGSSLRELV
jgi:hypothetical protein